MDRLTRGVHFFRSQVFPEHQSFYEHLAVKQQQPMALFITCSDSRMNPNLITQTDPGDLFLLRNAGNIVPPYGAAHGGEGATIEYAVAVLGIKHIIVCGHSHCGAMQALLHPESVKELPAVSQWFTYAEATRRVVKDRYGNLTGDDFERAVIEENVLVQLNNLSTHPYVTARLTTGAVNLYGWYYEIETGEMLEYDQSLGTFQPLGQVAKPATPLSVRFHGATNGKAQSLEPAKAKSAHG